MGKDILVFGGLHQPSTALLIFNVRGLTFTNVDVAVKINQQPVGKICRYGGVNDAARTDTSNYWYTQMIALNGSQLKNGNNEIQIEAVGWPGATNTNKFDDFQLMDVVCFFTKYRSCVPLSAYGNAD